MSEDTKEELPKSLEDRIQELEEKAKKHSKIALVISIIALLVGGSGLVGLIQYAGGASGRDADVRLKNAEAAAHDLTTASKRHDVSIAGLERLINQLDGSGDADQATRLREVMISQEAEFQLFITSMNRAMRVMWPRDSSSRTALEQYEKASRQAIQNSQRRRALLNDLATPTPTPKSKP